MRKNLQNPFVGIQICLLVTTMVLVFAGCSPKAIPVMEESLTKPAITKTLQPIKTITSFPTMTFAETSPTSQPTQTATGAIEPPGCQKPSNDYTKVEVLGHQLNTRTYEMLTLAQSYYGGLIELTGSAITQGSYTNAVEASFGTHAGGGAVDISVMAPGTFTILYADIEPLVRALRLAGFAAWYRDFNDLFDGSPPHIHAIAIGDRELSMPAREQLAGPHGYFWGYNGIPVKDGLPERDPHGGPIVCSWMVELGYPNKTTTPSPGETISAP